MKVYMPYDDRSDETTAGYRQILGNLQASIEYLTSDNMGIVGDFNVDPGRGRLWHYLYDFLQSNELVCADLNLPVDSCTYISPAHNTTAWLDHVITNKNTSIKNIKICYDIAVYDHFPVSFSLSLNFCYNDRIINKKRTVISEYVNWKDFNEFDGKHYRDNIDKLFADVHLCSGYKCNLDHRAHLDSTYKYLNYFKDFTKEFNFHKQRRFTPLLAGSLSAKRTMNVLDRYFCCGYRMVE